MILAMRCRLLLLGIFLSVTVACAPSLEKATKARNEQAKLEDALAECRLFALQEGFKDKSNSCQIFLEKDKDCSAFPEQKEGCMQFLRASSYFSQKLECPIFANRERGCAKLAQNRIPSWVYNVTGMVGLDWKKKNWEEQVVAFTPEIYLGAIWNGSEDSGLVQGLELALEEINAAGGVLGRKLAIDLVNAGPDLDQSRKVAEYMAADPKIRVVLGGLLSEATIPVTYLFENNNIVHIALAASRKNVIRHGMRFIFRQLPNNDHFAKALIDFCVQQNYRKLAILYSRDDHSEELSYAVRDYAVKTNLKILFERSFFGNLDNFIDVGADMRNVQVDAIFLISWPETSSKMINDLRDMGVTAPLIGSFTLDSKHFAQSVGEKGNGLVVPTTYNLFSAHPANDQFVRAFRKRYGYAPDVWAAQAYEAVNLVAYTMKEANSTVPANIAEELRYMPPQTGVSGQYAFEISGEFAEKPIYFKELQNEEFVLFKDEKREAEQTLEIVDGEIILRPEKPSESTEAMSAF